MIITLRPPDAAGPLRVGATGPDTADTLRHLGDPREFRRTADSRPAWAVDRALLARPGYYDDPASDRR